MIKLKDLIKEAVYPNNSREIVDTMLADSLKRKLDDFTKSYIAAALWSSFDALSYNHGEPDIFGSEYDEDDPSGVKEKQPEPLDKKYEVDDIEPNTLIKMADDCENFQQKYRELYELGGWDDSKAGHDFWLTRNGHGTGFWDRSYKQPEKEVIGKQLTEAAKTYGEYNLYLGDGKYDGLVCGG